MRLTAYNFKILGVGKKKGEKEGSELRQNKRKSNL
jgi:hypothetical protein